MSDYEVRFGALGRLYGVEGLEAIKAAHVAVIGLGGVGSWVVEALARTGVGKLTLVDMDEICLSNMNRQIHALNDTVGRSKAEILAERVEQIAPECELTVEKCFFTESTSERLLSVDYNYVVDAIDTTRHKCELIDAARKRGISLITCGGAGGRIDPARLRIDDLARSINDPLLLQVRKRLRKEYGFPRLKRQKFKVDCVFSDELPRFPMEDGSVSEERSAGADYRLNCDQGFGSATFVTGAMGFLAASHLIKKLVYQENVKSS
ncbi:MAG: tRNA threonylcarbamoyladenosine dehydratase [Verrucomicrobiota bacterium]